MDDGYTLMEALLTVAIVLILSCVFVITVAGSMNTLSQSFAAINTAVTMIRLDRVIRSSVSSFYLPYWENPQSSIASFTAELYRLNIGSYIIAVYPIRDSRRLYRGLEVVYSVNRREAKTVALFSFVPVLEIP